MWSINLLQACPKSRILRFKTLFHTPLSTIPAVKDNYVCVFVDELACSLLFAPVRWDSYEGEPDEYE